MNSRKLRNRIIKYYNGGNVPLSAMQIDYNILGQQNQFGNNFNNPYNQSFELQSGGYGNNMQQYTQGKYGGNTGLGQSTIGNYSGFDQGQGQNQGGISNGVYAGISAVGQLGTQLIEGSDTNPYNQQYGYQGTSAAGSTAASIGGPISSAASTVLGMIGSGLDQLTNSQEYNQYGVNTADGDRAITKGEVYAGGEGGFDALGQLTDDISEGNWGNTFLDLAGLSTVSSILSYKDEQKEAKEVETKARKAENLYKRQQREEMNLQTGNLNPTLTYPNGGVIDRDIINKNVVKTYGNLNNQWSNDPTLTSSDIQRYNQPTYVRYNNTLGNASGSFDILNQTTFSQDSTAGPRANYYRTFTDTTTGNKYDIPVFDTKTYDKYFGTNNKYATGGYHTMPDGNIMPGKYHNKPNAELETNEVFRTPDGSIEKVPEGTPSHKKGGIKLSLPEGTEILGKMKGKYKDKPYKELGQDLKKQYDKYVKIIEESDSTLRKKTAERMLNQVQNRFTELMEDQEVQKSVSKYHPIVKDDPSNPGALLPTEESEYTDPNLYANGGNVYGDDPDAIGRRFKYDDQSSKGRDKDRDKGWWERNKGTQGNIGDTLGTAVQFAPAAYNLYQGMFGNVDELNASDYRNPYMGQIRQDLGDINYNIRPELEANELAYQTARRNVRQVAPGTGALLSNYGALANTRMRADARAHAMKQNIEGQRKQQRAGIYGQLGAQEAQTRFNVDQYNAASQAAKRQSLQTGLSQLGESAYNLAASKKAQENQARYYNTLNSSMRNMEYDPITGQLRLKTIL